MTLRVAGIVVVSFIFLSPTARSETIQFSINLIVNDQEALSTGRAVYQPDSLCLECPYYGNHRINGGSTSASWNLPSGNQIYERTLNEWVRDGGCYRGFIEGWGRAGFYGSQETAEKCAPCVLFVEANGSGSVSGAADGKSSYNCGTGITLTATPANGWQFVRWGGSISVTSPSISFVLDASKSLTAFFEEIPPSRTARR